MPSPSPALDRNALIESNLERMQIYIKVFANKRRLDWRDLLSEGYFGLCKAAELCRPDRQTQFWTYAQHKVNGALLDYMRKRCCVNRNCIRARQTLARTKTILINELKRHPSSTEIAAKLKLTQSQYNRLALRASFGFCSDELAYKLVADERESMQPEICEMSMLSALTFSALITRLKPEQQQILTMTFVDRLKPSEIAKRLSENPAHIHYVISRSKIKLRNQLTLLKLVG